MKLIKCPGCRRSRMKKLDGQRVVCRSCSKAKRRVFQFCWACQREWPREASSNDSCILPNCALRAVLLSTKQISDLQSSVRGCPYFRACPKCKALLTHDGDGCPNIVCPQCKEEFCFRCMRPECYDDYDDYETDFDDSDYDIEIQKCVIKNNTEILQELEL
nr:probable E3 ubiquitin-protein ligase RNF144A-A [Misgurnus anguillicaudatus]